MTAECQKHWSGIWSHCWLQPETSTICSHYVHIMSTKPNPNPNRNPNLTLTLWTWLAPLWTWLRLQPTLSGHMCRWQFTCTSKPATVSTDPALPVSRSTFTDTEAWAQNSSQRRHLLMLSTPPFEGRKDGLVCSDRANLSIQAPPNVTNWHKSHLKLSPVTFARVYLLRHQTYTISHLTIKAGILRPSAEASGGPNVIVYPHINPKVTSISFKFCKLQENSPPFLSEFIWT